MFRVLRILAMMSLCFTVTAPASAQIGDWLKKAAKDIGDGIVKEIEKNQNTIEDAIVKSETETENDNTNRIENTQKQLQRLGYQVSVDGEYGPSTRGAILRFQGDYGKRLTGSVSDELMKHLQKAIPKYNRLSDQANYKLPVLVTTSKPKELIAPVKSNEQKKSKESAKKTLPSPTKNEYVYGEHLISGTQFKDCGDTCPRMVTIPAGSFEMGGKSKSERPKRMVTIEQSFAVGRFEISQEEWNACVADRACEETKFEPKVANHPATRVSWNDAKEYVSWLSQKTNRQYRLLTEAEWEYAARAGSKNMYSWGDEIGINKAHCRQCSSEFDTKMSVPVDSFQENQFGLYNMLGNVSEWVEDCDSPTYSQSHPTDGTAYLYSKFANCGKRSGVFRGGAFRSGTDELSVSYRTNMRKIQSSKSVGFRVARTLSSEAPVSVPFEPPKLTEDRKSQLIAGEKERCANDREIGRYYDCACRAEKLVEKYEELGPNASEFSIKNSISNVCYDREAITKHTLSGCESVGGISSNNPNFCSCVSETYATLMIELELKPESNKAFAGLTKVNIYCDKQ